jgi:hypothetical protein
MVIDPCRYLPRDLGSTIGEFFCTDRVVRAGPAMWMNMRSADRYPRVSSSPRNPTGFRLTQTMSTAKADKQ